MRGRTWCLGMAYYYIADLHFGHNAILNFDNRPFGSTEEMEEVLVANWNAVVQPEDTVFILGDFCWKQADEWLRIIRRLKGSKVLIQGNHDLSTYPPELRKEFADIKEYKEIHDNGRNVILSHYPILFYKRSNNPKYIMLCGHVHQTGENDYLEAWLQDMKNERIPGVMNCAQVINVGAMMPWVNYVPRTLDDILRGREAFLKKYTGRDQNV